MNSGREQQQQYFECAYGDLAGRPREVSIRTLTGPLNCAILSRCPLRIFCLERVWDLIDAFEAGDFVAVQRLLAEDL